MYDVSLAVAIVLALILFGSHHAVAASRLPTGMLNSLGGGMAVSYAFLQLLPELEEGEKQIGFPVHIWMLAGFILFCGLEHRLALRKKDGGRTEKPGSGRFLYVGLYGSYVFLVLLGTPFGEEHTLLEAGLLVAAMGLHFTYKNYCLHHRFGSEFHLGWSSALACSPLLAWVFVQFSPLHASDLREVVIAFVSGIVLSNVFREEAVIDNQSKFRWLVAGATIYAGLVGLEALF